MANTVNIVIDQGADYSLSLTWKDSTGNAINLTGYTARSMVRHSYHSPQPLISLTTENGGIEIDGANGVINVSMTAAQTANLPASNCVYDLEVVNGTSVTRLIEGAARITPEVTRG